MKVKSFFYLVFRRVSDEWICSPGTVDHVPSTSQVHSDPSGNTATVTTDAITICNAATAFGSSSFLSACAYMNDNLRAQKISACTSLVQQSGLQADADALAQSAIDGCNTVTHLTTTNDDTTGTGTSTGTGSGTDTTTGTGTGPDLELELEHRRQLALPLEPLRRQSPRAWSATSLSQTSALPNRTSPRGKLHD